MKILFKYISKEYIEKRIEFSEASDMIFQLLDRAFKLTIRVWHAGKDIPFDDELLDYINFDKLTINWGGYGSRISIEKAYDYFNFEYPGDEVIDGKLNSKVTSRKNSFKLVNAFFDKEVGEDVRERYISLGGNVTLLGDDSTLVWVTKETLNKEEKIEKLKTLVDSNNIKFIFISEEGLKMLFPAKIVRKASVPRVKKEIPKAIEQRSLSQLQKLLTSRMIDEINQGITLIEGLNDPEIYKYFLEGISILKDEDGFNKIIPNKYFDEPKIAMPLYNYTMLSLIISSKDVYEEAAIMVNQLDSLCIDLADFSILEKLSNLKKLKLSCSSENIKEFPNYASLHNLEVLDIGRNIDFINIDSIGQLTSLKKLNIANKKDLASFYPLASLIQLEYLDICNCEKIDSIDFVTNLNNLSFFDFSNCRNITKLSALNGKKLTNKYLSIENNRIRDLSGIIAYQELETLEMRETNDETDINKFKELISLPNLKNLYNYKSKANYQDPGELTPANTCLSLHIHYPSNTYQIKNDSYEMKFDLTGVDEYEAIGEKIFCKKLVISFSSLKSIKFLKEFKSLEMLELEGTKKDLNNLSNLDFSVLKEIQTLKNLELRNVNVENFEFLKELPQIESITFNDFATLNSFEGLQRVKRIYSYSGLYISTNKSEFKEEEIYNSCRELYYQTNNKPEDKTIILANSLKPIAENTNIASNIYKLGLSNFKQINEFGDLASYSNLIELSLDSNFQNTFSEITNWHEFPSLREIKIASNVHLKFAEKSDKINVLIKSSLAEMNNVNISGKGVGNIYISMHQGFDISNYFRGLESVICITICNAEFLNNLDFMNDIGFCEKLVLDTKKELQLSQINGLKKHIGLKHLEIPTAKKLTNVSVLKEMTNLQYLDLSTCTVLVVKPRPVLMKTREEVEAYQKKL